MAVVGQEDLSGEFEVDPGGMIDYAILGPVKASDMTTEEFERKLTTLLADGYLKRPDVSVTIVELWSQRVYVTGHVEKPGAYALKQDRRLLSLLADAGGATADAGHEAIVIRPPAATSQDPLSGEGVNDENDAIEPPEDEGEEQDSTPAPVRAPYPNEVTGSQVFAIPLEELLSGNPEQNIVLEPGDTVYFPRAANVYVTGHVARPGAFRFQPRTSVFQLINMAGGLTGRASKKIRIVRIVDGEQKEFRVSMTDAVMPEDTIVVPERFF